MSYLVLARKYRPQTFDEVVCQEHVTRTLTNAIGMGRVPHAVLFCGPRGTGKTTVARVLAKAMNCVEGPTQNPCNTCLSCVEITKGNAVDVFEIDGASNNSVEQIRELRENIRYMPAHSRYKIYIIDEVHMLSTAAFNALLKTLEEPPSHILFIFATTEPHKIPLTILSRCQRHDFKRVDPGAIAGHLKTLCIKEGFEIDDDSLHAISREAGGSMRDALSLLDQVLACTLGQLTREQVVDILGIVDQGRLFDISEAVFQADIPRVLELLDEIYTRGYDVKKLYSEILAHFRDMMIVKLGKSAEKLVDLPGSALDRMRAQIRPIPDTYLTQILDLLLQAESSVRFSDQPKMALEMIFIKLLHIRPALPIEALVEKIDHLRKNLGVYQSCREIDDPGHPAGQSERDALPQVKAETMPEIPKAPSSGGEDFFSGKIDLRDIWERLSQELKKKYPSIAAHMTEATLKNIQPDTVEIEVVGSEFQINLVMRQKSLSAVENVCNDFFGRKMNVRIHPQKKDNGASQKNQDTQQLKQKALGHPLVKEAMGIFKGEIQEVRIQQNPQKKI
jgi:DNA polymerase III subunit gamma/tau